VLHVNHCEGLNLLKRRLIAGLPFFLIEKYYPSRFSHVTALSEWTRRKVGGRNTFVLPAGIGEDLVEEGDSAPPITRRDDYVVFLGRLEINNKGLDTLMDAARKLGSLRLVLAGKGRDEQRLREMASGLPVEFMGFVTEQEKRDLLKRAAAFVLPSRFEGWGIAVLEAAAFGTPVVVSDIPELRYSIEDGYGVSFQTGDPESLARVLGGLLGDESARERMHERALEAARRHTWDRVARMYEDYLEGVIGEARS
jgi:glycosyltransferase involved in cell wall biosynthesis